MILWEDHVAERESGKLNFEGLTQLFNFTKAAEESNTENLLIIQHKALAANCNKNWEEHAKYSENYTGKTR